MVSEAEQYREEDEKQKERIVARLENYIFSVKQAVGDSGDKLSNDDKDNVLKACDESLKWLDNNSLADKEEYDDKMKELQTTCTPVMTKLHGGDNSNNNKNSHNSTGGTNGGRSGLSGQFNL